MGAGKSAAARDAGAALGEPVHDADRMLEERLGSSIEEFFAREGEAAFRAREEELVGQLLEGDGGGIVALGGGALGSERVRAALGRHTVVLVDVSLETAWARASGRGRPLAADRDVFGRLYAERQATYLAAAGAILPEGDRGLVTRALPALSRLRAGKVPEGVRLLWATAASGDYPVWIGPGALAALAAASPGGRAFCITDEHVGALYAGGLTGLGGVVEIPAGEEHKTLATAERVWRALAQQGVTRADYLVALGGGVVGDLAGFCAAGYQRGIAVVQAPTTLVAQVDSAYGGKTGVDLPEAKNYVGASHQPAAVVADTATLASLPPEEHAAGYAEVVKTALIAGGPLWERVASGAPVDDEVILGCARAKLAVVAADERDGGVRQVLNLGHTVGHAIETVTGYARLRHGEAVGLGLLAALRLSGQGAPREQVASLLEAQRLPVALEGLDAEAVMAATARDKKRIAGAVPFVLVDAPGEVRHGREVEPDALRGAVEELR